MSRVIVLLLLFASCSRFVVSDYSFNWLIGNWKIERDGTIIYERWEGVNSKQLSGKSYSVSGKDTLFSERISIVQDGDDCYYIAEVAHNPEPVKFKLIHHREDEIIFENKKHDFPKRIIYKLISNDSLYARVEDENKALEFYYVSGK